MKKVFAWIGLLLLCLLLAIGVIFIKALNYTKYDVKGDKTLFFGAEPEDYDLLKCHFQFY